MAERDLIDELVKDLTPVRRLTGSRRASVVLLAAGLFAAAALLVILFGLRSALPAAADAETYIVSELGALAGALFLAMAAGGVRVPGASTNQSLRTALLLFGVTGLGLMTYAAVSHDANCLTHMQAGWPCSVRVMILSIPALALGIWFTRRGAPVSAARAGFAVAGTAVAVGAAALPLVCVHAEAMHLLVAHLMVPLFLVTVTTMVFSRWLFRW